MQKKIKYCINKFCIFFLLLIIAQTGSSQDFFEQTEIINFKKYQYNGGTQNWNIKEDSLGRIYIANNEGLLTFDGNYWKLFSLPNKTIVRSLEFGIDNQLYAGGQDEFGFFSPDKNGDLAFTSLKNLIDESDQQFADIWNIVKWNNALFFRSKSKLFRYYNNKITVYQPWKSWNFIGIHQNQLIAHDEGKGLVVFKDGSWQILINKSLLPPNFSITSICPFGNASLITTSENGIFILTNNKLTKFNIIGDNINNTQFFNCSFRLKDDTYLIGTYNNGVYHINNAGRLIEVFSKNEGGLQNNNVQTIYVNSNNNIWLGLDNGIAYISYNSGLKHINPSIFNDGAGYSNVLFHNSLYFALSNGIYTLPLEANTSFEYTKNNIKKIAEGLSWQVSAVKDKLFVGKEDGFFSIINNNTIPIDMTTGYWLNQKITDSPFVIAAGNYLGINLFEQKNGRFSKQSTIPNFNTSSRFVEVDSTHKILWVSHPYRGVYKISLTDYSYTLYTSKNGLPSSLNNHVFKIKNTILIATEKGIYQYNSQTDQFQESPYYKAIFSDMSVRYLKEDLQGNIWFVHEKSIGIVDFSNKQPEIIYFPELKGKILSGFENIYPADSNNVFIGAEQGFYHINYKKYKQNIFPLIAIITSVKTKDKTEQTIFNGYYNSVNEFEKQSKNQIVSLPYKSNSIHFEYAASFNQQQTNIEYSYLLKGFDKEWSDWSKKTEKDYTNLPAGFYTFQVKARNNLNKESTVSIYSFYILSPWYNNIWSWIAYCSLSVLLLIWIAKQQEKRIHKQQEKRILVERMKHKEEQNILTYQHQIELEKSEKELIKLKNEKLEAEIEFKNTELATTVMNLVQKKEFLLKIKDELNKLNKSGKETIETNELKKILRSLTTDEKLNEEWERFSIHFNKVHSNFLITLKEKYPELKAHELRLCSYLYMNLSSKEIAHLMSISVRGVEISRYRLRKKLQLNSDVNLFQFLLDIESTGRKNNTGDTSSS